MRSLAVVLGTVLSCSMLLACSDSKDPAVPNNDAGGSAADASDRSDTDMVLDTASSEVAPVDSGAPGIDAPPPQDAVEFCRAVSRVMCAHVQKCIPHLMKATWGDQATCEKHFELACRARHDDILAVEDVAGCLAGIQNVSCDQIIDVDVAPLPACRSKAGPLENGSPCTGDSKCKSTFCYGTSGTTACGTCMALPKEGEDCLDRHCAAGLDCRDSKCVKLRATGAACTHWSDCNGMHGCIDGTCQPLPAVEGAPCSGGVIGCDWHQGLFCLGENDSSSQCRRATNVPMGETCQLTRDSYVLCQAAHCQGTISSDGLKGTCVPHTADGAACGPDAPPCAPPAQCIDRVCQMPGPRICP